MIAATDQSCCEVRAEQVTIRQLDLGITDAPGDTLVALDTPSAVDHGDHGPATPVSDFPIPNVLTSPAQYLWDDDQPRDQNFAAFGQRLAAVGDLYRRCFYAGGLLLASPNRHVTPFAIDNAGKLAPVIADRLRVCFINDGKPKGHGLPSGLLNIMLSSEVFLQRFRPVDQVTQTALYLEDFSLTRPGYSDGGYGNRIYYCGPEPLIERSTEAIDQFLGVMDFATDADRTNAVAAALTVLLHNQFIGAKPIISVTATKSHAGKDTVILFAAGRQRLTSISYQSKDWATERAFVGALKSSPDTVVVCVENARLESQQKQIASAFLERFVTDPEPLLFSTGSGGPVRRKNNLVVAISTNYGMIHADLMNRALPIHLEPVGNVADRQSPIGNPKLEYLPANADRIEAELRGMIERWKEAGKPLDADVRHPFTQWAKVVGGILQVNGYDDFLGNYNKRRTVDDPVRCALGLLGAARPGEWLRAADWAARTAVLGLTKTLITPADRDSERGRERGIGLVLSAHRDETFDVETDDVRLTLRLERSRRRQGGPPVTRYRFTLLGSEPLPEDDLSGP